MNKSNKIIIAIVSIILIIVVVLAVVILTKPKDEKQLEQINSAEDLEGLINKVYEGQENLIPNSVQTQVIDIKDDVMVKSFTGLDNGNDLEYLVVSEPMISSQAYSFVLLTVKEGVNANKIAETIKDKVDYRKWICVSAEKVYTTSSGNVVCLIMSSEEVAKPIYEKFKTLVGTIGQEYEKTEEIELPPEMY
ncbi:MAG: hypothetical protein HFJ20_06015 [Clostridia bacterium]|nr:hypothetical protein [Clostridia bacterium]